MKKFDRETFERLSESQLEVKIQELEKALRGQLSDKLSHKEFFDAAFKIIANLRSVGHDLWSWGYDGSTTELWGGDYMKPDEMGRLKIEFVFPDEVNICWGDRKKD